MKARIEISPELGLLRIAGRFDLHAEFAFRTAYRRLLAESHAATLAIDMAQTNYMDSSALGLLLIFRHDAELQGKSVALKHCNPFILRVLHTAKFDGLFAIGHG